MNRLFIPVWLAGCVLTACASTPAIHQAGPVHASGPRLAAHDFGAQRFDLHDFDFLNGEWDMANRRLMHRGVGSQEWVEFPSVMRHTQFLGGLVNVDEVSYPNGVTGKNDGPYTGLAPRTFDVKKQRWSIYWISGKSGCCLTDPVAGGFVGDRGEFYGTDDDDGRPVKVRFVWTRLGPDKAHWDRSFDYGDGKWR